MSTRGDVLLEDSAGCYVHADSRLVAALGLHDMVIVETADAVLVAPRAKVQDVKKLVARIKAAGRLEHLAHAPRLSRDERKEPEVINLSAFKAYDIRGRIPDEINADLVYQIGRAYAAFVKPKQVAVGRDIRLTSAEFAEALIRGLTDSGVDVLDIGLCGTEGVYFATFHDSSTAASWSPRATIRPTTTGSSWCASRANPSARTPVSRTSPR